MRRSAYENWMVHRIGCFSFTGKYIKIVKNTSISTTFHQLEIKHMFKDYLKLLQNGELFKSFPQYERCFYLDTQIFSIFYCLKIHRKLCEENKMNGFIIW